MSSGFDCLGAEVIRPARPPVSWGRSVLAVGAGILGAVLIPKHPVLAFLNAAAVASNVHAVIQKDRTAKDAIKRVGRHIVATAGSLALPQHPAVGYIAGAIAADLLMDGEGGGIIEEWSEYEGIVDHPKVVDAEFVEAQPGIVKVT